MIAYKLFWDEFSSWYLEIIKPEYQQPIDETTHKVTIDIFEVLLRLLHPFIPFITEEIWHLLKERPENSSLMNEHTVSIKPFDNKKIEQFEQVKEMVTFIRNTRAEKQIPAREKLTLFIKPLNYDKAYDSVIVKLGNLEEMKVTTEKIEGAVCYITSYAELYIPVGDLHDHEEELNKLGAELDYARGFLVTVMKKLDNESFVKNAPEKVLEVEKKKKTDTEIKIKALEERIASMKKV